MTGLLRRNFGRAGMLIRVTHETIAEPVLRPGPESGLLYGPFPGILVGGEPVTGQGDNTTLAFYERS